MRIDLDKLKRCAEKATPTKYIRFNTTVQKPNGVWICDCQHDDANENAEHIANCDP